MIAGIPVKERFRPGLDEIEGGFERLKPIFPLHIPPPQIFFCKPLLLEKQPIQGQC